MIARAVNLKCHEWLPGGLVKGTGREGLDHYG